MATICGSRWGSSMRSGCQLCSSTPATTFVSISYFLIERSAPKFPWWSPSSFIENCIFGGGDILKRCPLCQLIIRFSGFAVAPGSEPSTEETSSWTAPLPQGPCGRSCIKKEFVKLHLVLHSMVLGSSDLDGEAQQGHHQCVRRCVCILMLETVIQDKEKQPSLSQRPEAWATQSNIHNSLWIVGGGLLCNSNSWTEEIHLFFWSKSRTFFDWCHACVGFTWKGKIRL